MGVIVVPCAHMVDLSWYAPGPGASAPPSCRGGRPAVPNPICVVTEIRTRRRRQSLGTTLVAPAVTRQKSTNELAQAWGKNERI